MPRTHGDEPFPWLGVAFAAIPICLLLLGVVVGLVLCSPFA